MPSTAKVAVHISYFDIGSICACPGAPKLSPKLGPRAAARSLRISEGLLTSLGATTGAAQAARNIFLGGIVPLVQGQIGSTFVSGKMFKNEGYDSDTTG